MNYSTKGILFSLVLTLVWMTWGVGQEQDATLERQTNGTWKIHVPAVPGRTYFVAISTDMINWEYMDEIFPDTGSSVVIDVEEAADERSFFEVRYSDEPRFPNADDADFDHDGLTNKGELVVYNTDPLNPDTDGDGMEDGWEVWQNFDPLSTGGSTGPGGDPDGDGVLNAHDADPHHSGIRWLQTNFNRYRVALLGDLTDVPVDVNDEGVVLFEQKVWRYGESSPVDLAVPGATTYLRITGTSQPIEETVQVNTLASWAAVAINNGGAIIGGATYNFDPDYPRGLYWPRHTEEPIVVGPRSAVEDSAVYFYALTQDSKIIGVDTQVTHPSWPEFYPGREDLVTWSPKASGPSLLKPLSDFGLTSSNLFAGDHQGMVLLDNSVTIDAIANTSSTSSPDYLDVARIGEQTVAVGNSNGLIDGVTAVSELAGEHVSASGIVLGADYQIPSTGYTSTETWMNGLKNFLDEWVEPIETRRQWNGIQGYAISDGGTIAASAIDPGGNQKLVVLFPYNGGEENFQALADDATGPRYRKVSLTGLPLPDEEPQATEESDRPKEQTYVDAFNRSLNHTATDIYIPIGGSELALQVTRTYREEIWNNRHGLRPPERLDRPFGAGMQSNISSYIEFVEREENRSLEPISVTVHDEEGRAQRFGSYDNNYFFPMPSGYVEKKTFLNTLTSLGSGLYQYKKKFGTTLTFSTVDTPSMTIPIDRIALTGTGLQRHSYARLVKAEDRYGNSLNYTYGQGGLIPTEISVKQGANSEIQSNLKLTVTLEPVSQNIAYYPNVQRVKSITDPRGKVTRYYYGSKSDIDPPATLPNHKIVYLQRVGAPGHFYNTWSTKYVYHLKKETDQHPRVLEGKAAHPKHFFMYHITDGKDANHPSGNMTVFYHLFDTTKWAYHTSAPGNTYQQTGLPSLLYRVKLPDEKNTYFRYSGESGFVAPTGVSVPATHLTIGGSHGSGVSAYKMTYVRDPLGKMRWYEFTQNDVLDLAKVPGNQRPDDDGKSKNLMVSYLQMSIQSADLGTETYHFNPASGYALSQSVDFSGNTTQYHYTEGWDAPGDFRKIAGNTRFTVFDDPLAKIDALGQVETYAYTGADRYRMMERITHVDGSETEYTIDGLGRRTDEFIWENQSGVLKKIQHTHFDYHTTFPAFLTKRTVNRLEAGSEISWATDRVTEFDPYVAADNDLFNLGRLKTEWVDTGTETLETTTVYDENGNRRFVTDPRLHTTEFVYDNRNRITEVIYPDATSIEKIYDPNSNVIYTRNERGIWTQHVYDNRQRLQETIVDPDDYPSIGYDGLHLSTSFTYNHVGSLKTVTDPRGYVTTHHYDAAQRRTSTVTPHEGANGVATSYATTQFEYEDSYPGDPAGTRRNPGSTLFNSEGWAPTRIVDPRNYTTLIARDGLYREISRVTQFATGAPPAETRSIYRDADRTVTSIDPLENETEQKHDALGRVVQITVARGTTDEATTVHHYTSTDLLWKTVDPEGRETEFEYDGAGRQTHLYQPDFTAGSASARKKRGNGSPVVVRTFDPNGNVNAVTDPEGNRTQFYYDPRNRKIIELGPQVYDAPNATTYRPATLTEYDEAGNLTKVIDRRGLNINLGADPPVSKAAGSSSAAYTTETFYDAANRPYKVVQPDANIGLTSGGAPITGSTTTLTSFDANGNPEKMTIGSASDIINNVNLEVTWNTYDPANRLSTTTTNPTEIQPDPIGSADDATNITVTNVYDLAGNLTEVIDGEGQKTRFTYDGLNRQTETAFDPDDGARRERTRLIYDGANLIAREVLDTSDPGLVVERTRYEYDHQNRLQTVIYEGKESDNRHYEYDDAGNLLSVVIGVDSSSPDALRSVYYTYDTLNRVKTETSANVTHTVTEYDKAGNRLTVSHGGGGKSMTYTYDELNRLATSSEGSRLAKFGYDLVGNWHKRVYPNGLIETRDHDARNRVTSIDVRQNGASSPFSLVEQWHDDAGNVIRIEETQPNNTIADRILSLTYDRTYRLTQESIQRGSDTQVTDFDYDRANNRMRKEASGTGPATAGIWDYTYGNTANGRNSNQLYQVEKDNVVTNTFHYDDKGNLVTQHEGSETLGYAYDHENRLVKATLPNNYRVPDGTVLPGERDYLYQYDYRTRRVHRYERSTTPGSTSFGHTTSTFSGGTSVQEYNSSGATGTPSVHYVRGSDFGGGVGGVLYAHRGSTVSYYHYNGRGDVVTKSNSTGTSALWQTAYGAFGDHLDADTSGSNTDPQRANTKDELKDLAALNAGYRVRSIPFNIFYQRDPAGFVDGPNLYTYVRQNPWTHWDPLGLYETAAGQAGYNRARQYASEISGNPLTWWKVAPMVWSGVSGVNAELPGQIDNARKEINKSEVPEPAKVVAKAALATGSAGHSVNPLVAAEEAVQLANTVKEQGVVKTAKAIVDEGAKLAQEDIAYLGMAIVTGVVISKRAPKPSGTTTVSPALKNDPYSPEAVSRRQSETRRQLGLEPDPDVPIPDQPPGHNLKSTHTSEGKTAHIGGERNVNPKEEHSRVAKGSGGRGRNPN